MPSQLFGLDIGRSFVKVVQVAPKGSRKLLTAAAVVPTPGGGIVSESPVELSKVSDAIKTCVLRAKIETDKCAVSLIESQVVSRMISLPILTDKELASAINWEAEQYIPLPIKDVVLQYKVINREITTTAGESKMEVLLVAAPKRIVGKYINVVKGAGLAVEALETESSALVRSLTKPSDPATVIVSMGALSTELVVSQAGNVLFTRSIATGGVNLTRAIISEFNLPQKQAEEYKQTYGIMEDKLSGKVAAVLKPILDIVTGEILKAVEYCRRQIHASEVARVVICGGGAYLPGLSGFLVERTNIEVSLGDPWADFVKEGLVISLAGQGSIYSVATGLALRT
ncbi:type IV pilus assembly protein PilM [Candidatus Curtissbacteria bacterium]|nr:type IV pilus assembly protein PilM [Candidatus Curtissbacteria bacterium]